MLAPDRSPLAGLVEVDETEITCRSTNDPLTGGGGRSHQGKVLVVGAVEVVDSGAGPWPHPVQPSTRLLGQQPARLPRRPTWPLVPPPRPMDGPVIPAPQASSMIPMSSARWPPMSSCPGVHRIFSNLKVWALGVYHGLRRKHLSSPISTSSSSASTGAEPGTPHSDPSSASPPPTSLSLTTCCCHRKHSYKSFP